MSWVGVWVLGMHTSAMDSFFLELSLTYLQSSSPQQGLRLAMQDQADLIIENYSFAFSSSCFIFFPTAHLKNLHFILHSLGVPIFGSDGVYVLLERSTVENNVEVLEHFHVGIRMAGRGFNLAWLTVEVFL